MMPGLCGQAIESTEGEKKALLERTRWFFVVRGPLIQSFSLSFLKIVLFLLLSIEGGKKERKRIRSENMRIIIRRIIIRLVYRFK